MISPLKNGFLNLTANKHILFLGKRLDALKVAKQMGIPFSVIHNKEIKKQRKYFEICISENSNLFEETLQKLPTDITHVIPTTEYGVRIYERVIEHLRLANLITPYVEMCFNKLAMKLHAQKNDITITPYLNMETWDAEKILNELGEAVVVKKLESSGSRGQYFLNSKDEILKNNDSNVLVEKRIIGSEYSIESFVKNGQILFSNITSYHAHHICNILPAQLDVKTKALELNEKIIENFQIKNAMVHIEFYNTENGIIFGELAIRSPGGYIMTLLDLSYDFSAWKTLIEVFTKESLKLPQDLQCYSACWILHPGQGVLKELPDFSFIQADPSFVDMKSALKKGPTEERLGSGEDYGRILLKNKNYPVLLKSIETIKTNLKYNLDPIS